MIGKVVKGFVVLTVLTALTKAYIWVFDVNFSILGEKDAIEVPETVVIAVTTFAIGVALGRFSLSE